MNHKKTIRTKGTYLLYHKMTNFSTGTSKYLQLIPMKKMIIWITGFNI